MAVLASAQITLSSMRDIKAAYRYYLLQSSTMSPPAQPTTNPPGGNWDDTEPSYTEGSTNTLYTVDITVFSDDTFFVSAVSKSSSYEAAKQAYNKAVTTQQTLITYQTATDENLDSITSSVVETQTQITTTAENIYDALGQLQNMAVSTEELETVKQLLISQWSDELEMRFTTVQNLLDTTNGTIEENQRLLEEYIRFEGARITLGRSDSSIQAVLSNDRLAFVENGQEVAYISNRTLYIHDAYFLGSCNFNGKFLFSFGETGTFDFDHIGG